MIRKLKEILGRADDVFRRYPMVLTLAFIAAIGFNILINDDFKNIDAFALGKFIISVCLGISVMFGLKMLSERIGKEALLQLLGLACLVAFYFILPHREEDFTEKYAFVIIPTFILSHLLVSFVPFLGKSREMSFWHYNKNLFMNVVLTLVFTGVLTGGVELAIAAMNSLFELHLSDKIFMHVFAFLSVFGSCFIFLIFNAEGISGLETGEEYPVILKFFTQFVLIPLLFLYAAILYLYSAKILIKWELPRGWVSLMILAYSVVGLLALLLVHPLKQVSTKSWVKGFSKIFYYSLLPLLVLLFTAIFTRFLEYGFTEPRYFVLMLAIWLSCVVFYFIFVKKATIKFIPISLFAVGLFSLVCPYLNAFSVSKRSQKAELEKILSENNILKNGVIDFRTKITSEVSNEISDKFRFLKDRGEEKFLLGYLPENERKNYKNDDKYAFNSIGSKFENVVYKDAHTTSQNYHYFVIVNSNNKHSISGYSEIIQPPYGTVSEVDLGKEKLYFNRVKSEIKLGNETWDIQKSAETIISNYHQTDGTIFLPEISAEHEFKNHRLKVIFNMISRNNAAQISPQIEFVLISEK